MKLHELTDLFHKVWGDCPGDAVPFFSDIERFAGLVVAAEREACANVCEILAWNQDSTWKAATMDCAAAIRARGQE